MSFTKPTSVNTWSETGANIVIPDAPHQQNGWLAGESPPAQFFNSLLNVNYQWFRWIDERVFDGDFGISPGFPNAQSPGLTSEYVSIVPADQQSTVVIYGGTVPAGTDQLGGSVLISGGQTTGDQDSFVSIGGVIGGASGTTPNDPVEHLYVGGGSVNAADGIPLTVRDTSGFRYAIFGDAASNSLTLGQFGVSSDMNVYAAGDTVKISTLVSGNDSAALISDATSGQVRAEFSGNVGVIFSDATTSYCSATSPAGNSAKISSDATTSYCSATSPAGNSAQIFSDATFSKAEASIDIDRTASMSVTNTLSQIQASSFSNSAILRASSSSSQVQVIHSAGGIGTFSSDTSGVSLDAGTNLSLSVGGFDAVNISSTSCSFEKNITLSNDPTSLPASSVDSVVIAKFITSPGTGVQAGDAVVAFAAAPRTVVAVAADDDRRVIGIAINSAAPGGNLVLVAISGVITPRLIDVTGSLLPGQHVQTSSFEEGALKNTNTGAPGPVGTNIGTVVSVETGNYKILINKY